MGHKYWFAVLLSKKLPESVTFEQRPRLTDSRAWHPAASACPYAVMALRELWP